MSSPTKTPSPSHPVPQNTPMAPPATPTTRGSTADKTSSSSPHDDTVPSTPGSHSKPNGRATPLPSTPNHNKPLPRTPNRATPLASPRPARTPGGTLLSCKSDPSLMTVVKVHTARCTECDLRNKDTMLRCPGCTFQICKPCRERREKQGRSLVHGNMMSPGGLGSGFGLGSGRRVTRRVVGALESPTPPPKSANRKGAEEEEIDEEMAEVREQVMGKGKKPSTKKRATGKKSKQVLDEDESSDDDFMPDPKSPTSHKRRRTTLAITDTPTATSARPSRTGPTSSTYIEPHSPSSSSVEPEASTDHPPSNLNPEQLKQAWSMKAENVAVPTGRVQELLEAQGVNTAENRYESHFLARHEPVMRNRVIEIPESVRRMAGSKQRMSAVQKHEARVEALLRQQKEVDEHVKAATVRGQAHVEAAKYHSEGMHADEFDELSNAIKEVARKWANNTHDALPHALQSTVARGLDMRLDHIDEAYTVQLFQEIEQCAVRKLNEFAADRGSQGGA